MYSSTVVTSMYFIRRRDAIRRPETVRSTVNNALAAGTAAIILSTDAGHSPRCAFFSRPKLVLIITGPSSVKFFCVARVLRFSEPFTLILRMYFVIALPSVRYRYLSICKVEPLPGRNAAKQQESDAARSGPSLGLRYEPPRI